jgi:hypothetical protein
MRHFPFRPEVVHKILNVRKTASVKHKDGITGKKAVFAPWGVPFHNA